LKDALNTIWEVEPKPGRTIRVLVRDRLLSFAMVGCICFLLLVSLVASAVVGAASDTLASIVAIPQQVFFAIDWTVTLLMTTVLFAALFKFLPDAKIAWREVWFGAVVTAVLFTIGKVLIGLYLGNLVVASAYGAAGSLVIVLLWTYYSSQILLFGAELTQAHAKHRGVEIVPSNHARRVTAAQRAQQGTGAAKPTKIEPPRA
jgi:membrane protein